MDSFDIVADFIFRAVFLAAVVAIGYFALKWGNEAKAETAQHEAEYCQRFDMVPVGGFCMTEAEIVLRRIPEAR